MDLCSVLLYVHPETLAKVRHTLEALASVEVHGVEADGRMLITVEGDDPTAFGETVLGLRDINGIIDANLVYHYHDDEDEQPTEILSR